MAVIRYVDAQQLLHSLAGQANLHADYLFPLGDPAGNVLELDCIGIIDGHAGIILTDHRHLHTVFFGPV
ncbi:hypothetical protein SDC9_82529 [bioreactor metagenome]|uniref:Uncharacterized protein n=1 Tax=bioreactor metagenome TaxID=1076179 RepID=A0A644Z4U4_9ZZZZ